ncbi:hypothetical protein KSC_012230 [Ktedonobacter sp. SOSP1-52]|uniref:hypothetical protein n=1 Tax=Ktedonobacter sp. SOSP1-52 TaxID=2778366 RepID=UPI0019157225|nr:hypothetical protein [Ktedonobacter sp. SOSP1-52]GHO62331.1 hypothetical protein KSC_012230 [Ktedonobacter sp. SOSP1-52]
MQINPKVVWTVLFIAIEIVMLAFLSGVVIVFYKLSSQQMVNKVIEFEIYFHAYLLVQLGVQKLVARAKKEKQAKKPTNQ